MSVFTGGPYGRMAVMLNTLSYFNIEIIIIIIIIFISIFAFKGELNGNILLVRFFFFLSGICTSLLLFFYVYYKETFAFLTDAFVTCIVRMLMQFEPRRKKTGFLHICENKDADQLRGFPRS